MILYLVIVHECNSKEKDSVEAIVKMKVLAAITKTNFDVDAGVCVASIAFETGLGSSESTGPVGT